MSLSGSYLYTYSNSSLYGYVYTDMCVDLTGRNFIVFQLRSCSTVGIALTPSSQIVLDVKSPGYYIYFYNYNYNYIKLVQ